MASTAAPFPQLLLRLIRALALIVVLISGYLLVQKINGQISSLAGCGGEDGCAQVLGGRWSAWFRIPVTVFAGLLYVVVFIAALPPVARARPKAVSMIFAAAAVMAGGAAVWFFGILLFVEKSFCPYCFATHVCGIAFAAIALGPLRRALPDAGMAPVVAGTAGVIILALGQLIGPAPDTAEIVEFDPPPQGPVPQPPEQDDSVSFLGGRVLIDPKATPFVGPEDAPHAMVELFDYTCGSCREMYKAIGVLREKYPDQLRIFYLPCPLNRRCNIFLREGVPDHQHACELARISLAVWFADRARFPEMHRYLMTSPLPIPPGDARAKAVSLVGKDAFEAAEGNRSIEALLSETFSYYALIAIDSPQMPQLLLGGNRVHRGLDRSMEAFVARIAKAYGLE